MSHFPVLQPTSRQFVPGTVPVSTFMSIAGKETRVITGANAVSHSITLSFANVSENVARQIMTHWYGRQGVALAFTLPSALWAGWVDYTSAVEQSQEWRYQSAPSIQAVSPSIMSLSVQLVSVL